MKILKEIVFSRVKAYNCVQLFHFPAETLEAITAENCSVYQTTGLTPMSLFNLARPQCQQDAQREH